MIKFTLKKVFIFSDVIRVKVDDFLCILNGVTFSRKLCFTSSSKAYGFLLSDMPLFFQEITLGNAVFTFFFSFAFFVILSSSIGFDKR